MSPRSPRVGKQHILDIAEGLFTEHGFRAVSIRDIAAACGVTNAALYYHFSNKNALFSEVLEEHAKRLSDHMREAAEDADSLREQIIAMLVKYSSLAGHRCSPLFLLRHKSDGLDRVKARLKHGRLIGVILEPLEEVLNRAVEAGELLAFPDGYSAASLLFGMLHGMGQHRKMCFHENIQPQDVRIVVDIFWDGMNVK